MTRAGRLRSALSGWFPALAAIALIVQLVVPPGFMIAPAVSGPTIVICTGHGPLLSPVDRSGGPNKSPAGKAAPVCAFAGLCCASTLADSPQLTRTAPLRFTVSPVGQPAVDPGRGLAAPPPPAQAPPARLS